MMASKQDFSLLRLIDDLPGRYYQALMNGVVFAKVFCIRIDDRLVF